jgi:hypothetical protein
MHMSNAQVGKVFSMAVGLLSVVALGSVAPVMAEETVTPVSVSGDAAVDEAVKFIKSQRAQMEASGDVSTSKVVRKIKARRSDRHVYIMGGAEAFPL